MFNLKQYLPLALLAFAPAADAQFAVIDVGAIAQLVQQVTTLQEQLTQAREEFDSMTGARGMERLLHNVPRNYLPSDWAELADVMEGTVSSYGVLSRSVQRIMEGNAVLTPRQLERLSDRGQDLIDASRRTAAVMQAMGRESLETTSDRFASIQELTDAIPSATDQKGILDLQARIATENLNLANQAIKEQVFARIAQAEEMARQQQLREQAIADVGSLRDLPPMGL